MTVSNFASSCGAQHGLGVAPEIGAGHRDDMRLVAGDELRRDGGRACCRDWPRRGGTRRRRSAGRRTSRRRTCRRRSGRSHGCRPAPCRRSPGTRRRELTLPPLSAPGALQRFHFGSTVQSAQKPYLVSGSSWKLAPIDFSGTTMIACLRPWFCSLSSAMNMSARLLPDAGGDLIRRYCSPRCLVGALLHRPHAERVGLGRAAVAGVGNRNGGD